MVKKTDKRKGKKPNKPYCGTKKPASAETASFRLLAKDAFNSEDYEHLKEFFAAKEKEHLEIMSEPDIGLKALNHVNQQKGNYYTALGNDISKPWLNSKLKCNNAWYWHNEAELIRRTAVSVQRINDVERVCEEHNWDEDQSREIQLEVHERYKRWVSSYNIKNMCRSKTYSLFPEEIAFSLDYGTQSKYTINNSTWRPENQDETISYSLKIGDKTQRYTLDMSFKIPQRIILQPIRIVQVGKPRIYHDQDYAAGYLERQQEKGVITDDYDDLVISIPYHFFSLIKENLGDGILGVDLGINRIFRAAAVYDDHYVENLDPSLEVERCHLHVCRLMKLKERLYAKKTALAALLANKSKVRDYVRLYRRLQRLELEYSRVRSNIAAERESLNWLVAGELVALCREFSCGSIHFEDLRWVGGSGQSWDFGSLRSCTETVAARYGVSVEIVSAWMTSRTDPSTGEELIPGDDRSCVWGDGSIHDRDGSAAVCIGLRNHRGQSRGSGVRVSRCCGERVRVPYGRVGTVNRAVGVPVSSRCPDAGVDVGFRPSPEFSASCRERVRDLLDARKIITGLNVFSFVGASRSVARLFNCRNGSPVPGYPAGSTCPQSMLHNDNNYNKPKIL